MKRLVFIVEGGTEISFVNQTVVPYLLGLGFNIPMTAQTIITNRKLHSKGGVVNYQYYKNDVLRVLAQPETIVTSLIDFFKLPTNFPDYTIDSNAIAKIEAAIHKDLGSPNNFIPYIQRHEIESLMFSDIKGFELMLDKDAQLEQIKEIVNGYPNPEDINNSPETAPSKRLEKIYNYDKISDGELIFEMIGIENIIEKCPRFSAWLNLLVNKLDEFNCR